MSDVIYIIVEEKFDGSDTVPVFVQRFGFFTAEDSPNLVCEILNQIAWEEACKKEELSDFEDFFKPFRVKAVEPCNLETLDLLTGRPVPEVSRG